MYRFVVSLSCAFALAAAPAFAQAAPAAQGAAPTKAEPTKTVAGTITSVSGSSVTVKTSTGDMTFNIDQKTRVIERGGSTKARAAQAEGKPGVPMTDVLKTGENVEVKYHETGMHAASIRALAMLPGGAKAGAAASGGEGVPAAAPKAQTATGTVSSVSGNSLTVKAASGDMTFSVDAKTTVSGTGIGTAGRKLAAEGAKPVLSEFLKEGDTVSVTYHDTAGTNHASVIRIVRKKP
jgi:Domain of unknown function (DUF5666)